jgi:hypothetical protein
MNGREISGLQNQFFDSVQMFWPVATGSLSLRKSPCIRRTARLARLDEVTAATHFTVGTGAGDSLSTFQTIWCLRFVLRFAMDGSCKT